MNNKNNQSHLSEDELVVALIDEEDLPFHRHAHLSQCRECASKKETLHQQLNGIGQKAAYLTPLPSKKPCLPQTEAKQWYRPSGYLAPAFLGSALVIVLAIMAAWWSGALHLPFKMNKIKLGVYAQSDDILLMQVSALIDNPLPDIYREVADIVELDVELDMEEEMTDFIVPLVENSISRIKNRNTCFGTINISRSVFYKT